ncbi:hypothetical protein K2173_000152 [Erythroxylum novogranatense]|uniref:Uncharacterized protein n=1 Tax=Erythroxylum novogranatense TaxID=1862640 RepID=A0AAV8SNW3_9ROSI|nr:hypothetical protein K2173_000152 [Erythroxylum novogranatense]
MAMGSSWTSANVAVEKATSDLLLSPDWTMNIDICDSVNSSHWAAKDVVKAAKKRLQHKNPRVQLLALTLLETMVKNCGDFVHFQIAEKNLLGEMVKIAKKKTDMHVRDKILVLLDSWQEAFGGPGCKFPQYYSAYEELRRSGVQFPKRSGDTAPIFTPPANHPATYPPQAGYGMPSNASRRLDETMATDIGGLSSSGLDSMRNVMELLSDMLQAVRPDDREAVKDEIIIDLVNQCRSNQKMLMQMLTTTGDEELLDQGLELNDSMQILLAKYDAIASGSPMPAQVPSISPKSIDALSDGKPSEETNVSSPTPSNNVIVPVANVTRGHMDGEEEEEDDFAMLARRHSRTLSSPAPSTDGTCGALMPVESSKMMPSALSSSNIVQSDALALPDPPASVKTTKELDMIEFLNLTLANTSTSPNSIPPSTPPASNDNMQQTQISSATQGYPHISQGCNGNQGQVSYNSYVVPWAESQPANQLQPSSQLQQQFQAQPQPQQQYHTQPQQQLQPQSLQQYRTQHRTLLQPQPLHQYHTHHPQTQLQSESQQKFQAHHKRQLQSQSQQQFNTHLQTQQQFGIQNQTQLQPQPQQQFLTQPQYPQSQQQLQAQLQPHLQPQYPQFSSGYPPPPWASTSDYANGQYNSSTVNTMNSTSQVWASTSDYANGQYNSSTVNTMNSTSQVSTTTYNSFPMVSTGNTDPSRSSVPWYPASPAGQKTFTQSYRLFEDLNVLGGAEGRYKTTNGTS